MKKSLMLFGLLGCCATSVCTIAITDNGLVNNAKKAGAAVPTDTRRVWIVDNNGEDSSTKWWNDTGKIFYGHVWNSNGTVDLKITHRVLSDYYHGLWYFDVDLPGAANSLKVIIRAGDTNGVYGWGNNNQTKTLSLGELGTDDTIWMDNGVSYNDAEGRNDRNAGVTTTNGFSEAQFAVVMSKYDTCSPANTNGYNAYPQFKKNFVDKTNSEYLSAKVYGQDEYTCQDYINGMAERYNANL